MHRKGGVEGERGSQRFQSGLHRCWESADLDSWADCDRRCTLWPDMAASSSASAMSEREAAVYDRAIRLWGAEAQKRLMTAKVLICGIDGLAAEVRGG